MCPMYKLIACFLTGAMLLAGSAFADQTAADPTAADTNMEILKQKLKADKKLLGEALSVEDQEIKLKHTYAEQLEKVLPANKVARYIQIESKIRSLIKYEMAQQIPLVY